MSQPAFELVRITDFVAAATRKNCEICFGGGWVCENHPMRPWDETLADGCECGPGMPCKCTGLEPWDVE